MFGKDTDKNDDIGQKNKFNKIENTPCRKAHLYALQIVPPLIFKSNSII